MRLIVSSAGWRAQLSIEWGTSTLVTRSGGSQTSPVSALLLVGDPLGQLTLRETVLVEGEGVQNVMRWEDYTQTAIDPNDDCTIGYVGDYIKKAAQNYSSRIGAFRMPGCRDGR